MTRSRSLVRSMALALLGLVLGSGVTELYLRIVEVEPLARVLPAAQASLYGPDPDTGYAHRPGARGLWLTENRAWVEINGLGLRDRQDRDLHPKPGHARVAIAGDSFIEALQVDQRVSFPALAERLAERPPFSAGLNDASDARLSGRPIEIVNLGLAGATPAVTVERLRTRAPTLELDAAIVIFDASSLLRQRPDDTSEFVGYVPGPDGKAVLSHAFRDTRSYKLRTGSLGRAMYWLLDHSRLALLLNNRKNAGLLAELAESQRPSGPKPSRDCTPETLRPHDDLWSGRPMGFAQARLDAMLFELKRIAHDRRALVAIGLRGLPAGCSGEVERLASLKSAIQQRIRRADEAAGLRGRLAFFDIEAAAARLIPPGKTFADLTGWGTRTGSGHLNELGHQVYAVAIVEMLAGKAR